MHETKKRQQRIFAVATLLGACALLAGCSNYLRVEDNSAPSATLRGVVRLGESKSGGIEGEWTRLRATGSQRIETASIQLGDTLIAAPDTLLHRVQADRLFLGYNHRLFRDRPVEMEWFAGAAHERIHWTVTPRLTGVASNTKVSSFGVSGGILGRYKFTDHWSAEARVRGAAGRVNGVRAELAFGFRPPGTPLRLRLGYAHDDLEANDGRVPRTDLGLKTKGPFAALSLDFD